MQVIELKGKVAEDYIKKSYDSAWEEFDKLDPENAAKFKKLLND